MSTPERISLHRYELLPERRTGDRRNPDRRSGDGSRENDRSGSDRRQGRPLTEALAVRRIFPIAEGAARPGLRSRETIRRRALAAADALATVVAVSAVVAVTGTALSVPAVLGAALIVVVLAKCFELYDGDDLVLRRSTLDEFPRLAQLAGLVALVYWIGFGSDLGRAAVLGLCTALALTTFVARATTRWVIRVRVRAERCLVIGDAEVGEHIKRKIEASRANAYVTARLPLAYGESADVLGGVDGLRSLIEGDDIDRVILAPTSTDAADTLELVRICKLLGVRVSILPRLFEVVGSAVEFDDLDGMTLLGVRRFGLSRLSRRTKRAFDLVGSLTAIIVLSPILAAIAVAVRVSSPGPVLFRQLRVGRDDRRFSIYKFRTMTADAEARKEELRHLNEAGDGLFKVAADPRVTRVGRLLRKSSLDELPQLLNVVRGEMSLVGPRPLVLDEDALVSGLDRSRLHLTPGMTGPWQVLGKARVPMGEMVGMDYLYVANWSLWRDFKLLVRTLPHMLARSGT